MKKLLILLALVSTGVIAALPYTPTVSWEAPTTFDNGTPLLEPLTYRLKCTNDGITTIYESATESYTFSAGELLSGNQQCVASALTASGLESVDSSPLAFIVPVAIPSAPTNLQVQ